MKYTVLVVFVLVCASCSDPHRPTWIAESPADQQYTAINKAGETVLPLGRIVTPYGQTFTVAPHPFGLTLSPDGQTAVTANSGTAPLSISIIRDITGASPEIQQVPEGHATDRGILESVFMGLAISPEQDRIYVAGGQANSVYLFDLVTGEKRGEIDVSTQTINHGYIGDLRLSADGGTLYAVDQIGFRLLVIDTATEEVTHRIPTGRYPFGLALSPDGRTAYVANVGMYEYRWLPDYDPENPAETALSYPPFAYQSPESIHGIDTDSLVVPGLGDPNAPESFSIWEVDLESARVTSKIKTGVLVGDMLEDFPAVGGASPNSVVATENHVFVSNGNNDLISVIDTENDTVVASIDLQPDSRLGTKRGVIPFGLALSPDQQRLYVAESGLNAIGVVDALTFEVLGHIPAGWFPSKLAVTPDGKHLVVANAKGYGSGPNGGSTFELGPEGSYVGGLMKGSVSVMPIPSDQELEALTRQVIENNFAFYTASDPRFAARRTNPVPLYPGEKESPIKHIVFVSKENRTYDEVFGQLERGKGEAALARFGLGATFSNASGNLRLENVDVMPNHLALARRFAVSDNFYVNADHSADGHRWLVLTYPNQWVETSVVAAYGGNRSMRPSSTAPGNLAFEGASGAIYPEDYNEAGSMWEHMERHDIQFWNFGFGTMFAPHLTDDLAYPQGYAYAVNYPVPAPIFDKTSQTYPTYNMAIPDQFRIDRFIEEFESSWMTGEEPMPQVLTIIIGADHGAGERPEAGFPFLESYMADNDLALGRLVEYLSTTPYWKNMAIVVTEDDAQGGVDHVDAHRSLLMVISPYAKRDYVSSTHTSFGSIFKTFWNILGIPHLNHYDYGATDLADLFTAEPDTTPFTAIPIDPRLFDPEKALDPLDEAFDRRALLESPALDDPAYLMAMSREEDEKRKQAERE